MSIGLKLRGLPEVKALLKQLGSDVVEKELRAASRKAFKPVLLSAQAKAPKPNKDTGATGLTARSLKISAVTEKGRGVVVGITVARSKGESGRDPSWRWHFTELGTRHQRAKPFIRPALDANAQKVLDILSEELAKGIKKAMRKKTLNDIARATARSMR